MKKQKSQKGIVLLSCLVFLLILTSLVKYTMSSAKMDELKSGADFDEMSAKEAALLAIKDAEDFILRRTYDASGVKQCLLNNNSVSSNSACKTRTVREDGEYATAYWREPNNWKNGITAGVYDGDDPNDRCNDEVCSTSSKVKGVWYEETSDCKTTEAVICYGRYTGRTVLPPERAKYVIEVFKPEGSVFGKTLASDEDGGNTMVIRVTAVGYSQDVKNQGNFKADAVPNNTYAMYQSTYILSSE